jgi:ankyrin repeat protein
LPAVRALLDSGVDVDKAATYHRIFPNTRYGSSGVNSTEGEIALQCAAKKGHLAVVKALIKAGADVNRQDNYENTALGAATAQGSTLVVMELIKAGADVNLADDMGATPIFSAAELGNSIIVALLIQAGADVNRIDEDDMKPIDLALRYSNDDDWREDLGANGASIEEYKKCVEMLRYAAS